jgi:NADH:ubiquinone oxidoreductase subunit K
MFVNILNLMENINILAFIIFLSILLNITGNIKNILNLFITIESLYIIISCYYIIDNTFPSEGSALFIIIITIASIKSIVGLSLLINYIRVYNTIYI